HRAARQANQAGTEALEVLERYAALFFTDTLTNHAQPGGGDQPAEIFVTRTIRHQDIKPAPVLKRKVRADDRLDSRLDCGLIEARCAVKSVAVAERERRVAELRG